MYRKPKNTDQWQLYDEIIAYVSDCFRKAVAEGDYATAFKAAEMILTYWRKKEGEDL